MYGIIIVVILYKILEWNDDFDFLCFVFVIVYLMVVYFFVVVFFCFIVIIVVDRFFVVLLYFCYCEFVIMKCVFIVLFMLWLISGLMVLVYILLLSYNDIVVVVLEVLGFFVISVVYF